MSTSACLADLKYDRAAPLIARDFDAETARARARDEFEAKASSKQVLDALGASVWQVSHQTFGYRWRGADTLNWGNLDDWIQIKWVQCLVEGSQIDSCLQQHSALQHIIASAQLHEMEEMFSFRDASTVQRFLLVHPHLIGFILETYPHLLKYFGSKVQVALQVVRDPEATNSEQLFAYIITSLPAQEALTRLDKFDQEWFLDELDRVGDLFNFNLEII